MTELRHKNQHHSKIGRRGFVLLAGAKTLTQTHANRFLGALGVMSYEESRENYSIT